MSEATEGFSMPRYDKASNNLATMCSSHAKKKTGEYNRPTRVHVRKNSKGLFRFISHKIQSIQIYLKE